MRRIVRLIKLRQRSTLPSNSTWTISWNKVRKVYPQFSSPASKPRLAIIGIRVIAPPCTNPPTLLGKERRRPKKPTYLLATARLRFLTLSPSSALGVSWCIPDAWWKFLRDIFMYGGYSARTQSTQLDTVPPLHHLGAARIGIAVWGEACISGIFGEKGDEGIQLDGYCTGQSGTGWIWH